MLVYAALFLIPMVMTVLSPRTAGSALPTRVVKGVWWLVFAALVLLIGLRHEVGGDWSPYLRMYELAAVLPWELLIDPRNGDAAYMLVNALADRLGLGIYFVNTVCALIFSAGLVLFCRAQPQPWLALVVAIPYLVTVVAMGFTRQSVAIGLVMPALLALEGGRAREFLLWTLAAMLFHKSAVVLLPLALLASTHVRLRTLLAVIVALGVALAWLLEVAIRHVENYELLNHDSAGATVRVLMNVLPAIVLLLLWRRFRLRGAQARFWFWFAVAAILQLVALTWFESSSIVDRLGYYWIPLQLFVWSRLPGALDDDPHLALAATGGVLLYSAAVMIVWLGFAHNAYAFIDYRNWLFVS